MNNSNVSATHKHDEDTNSRDDTSSTSSHSTNAVEEELASFAALRRRTLCICLLIVSLGMVAGFMVLMTGISSAWLQQEASFRASADDLVDSFWTAWREYERVGEWIHAATASPNPKTLTAQTFRQYYEHAVVANGGLEFEAASLILNVSHAEREALEQATVRNYFSRQPNSSLSESSYRGFTGIESDNGTNTCAVQARSVQPFYFIVHLIEPVESNEAAIDFDLYSSAARRIAIHTALETSRPALTDGLTLVQESNQTAYSVLLIHPGFAPTEASVDNGYVPRTKPQHLCNLVIRIPNLLERASRTQREGVSVFLFDLTPNSASDLKSNQHRGRATAKYLGGIETTSERSKYAPDRTIESIFQGSNRTNANPMRLSFVIDIASNKQWSIVVVSSPGSYQPNIFFVVLGGSILMTASIFLAVGVYTHSIRIAQVNQIKNQSAHERSKLIVENARQAAILEQDLNDFIAHEVRNPVAAALAACSFVTTAVNEEPQPLLTQETREATRQDVSIIALSLTFINDLLRDMLDMHRASSKKIKVKFKPTDIVKDVLEPVDHMLYRRGCKVQVLLECDPPQLYVMSDPLRLKQIVFNLARNSLKFLTRGGFIRLTARVVDDTVQLAVEDSGEGIPPVKRRDLFSRFQQPMDTLCQGTGLSLFLCKNLSDLLHCQLWLDKSYHSGIDGQPGARFVLDLQSPLLQLHIHDNDIDEPSSTPREITLAAKESFRDERNDCNPQSHLPLQSQFTNADDSDEDDLQKEAVLPEILNVLLVDDDLILQKLFARTIRLVAPLWSIEYASSGEVALRMVEKQSFDLIFMDQHMASVDKSLLGSQTVREMRSKGISSVICGLSANDVEEQFIREGADCFLFKPFPCEKRPLIQELRRILKTDPPVPEEEAT